MQGFELNDKNMDIEFEQSKNFNPKTFESQGVLKDQYSDQEIVAFLNEILTHEAQLWRGHNAFGNIYSCVLFTQK